MAAVTFDTLEFVETLKEGEVSEIQAKAIAKAMRNSQESANLATKNDLDKLETGLRHEISDVRHEISDVRHEISDLRKDMDAKFAGVDAKLEKLSLRLTVRLGGIVVAGITVIGVVLPIMLKLLHVF